MTKHILVTGAAGFIGFHLAKALAQRKDIVLGYDNFNDYYSPTLKRQRAQILKEKGIPVIEADICDAAILQQTIESNDITHIVHLAAQAGVRYSLVNPQAYIKSNIEGFVNILEACRHNSKIKLIYASSSSVYGHHSSIPFSENNRTDSQASLYGVTKKTNELLASTYHHLYGIPITGLRFFTVYGPWGRPDMAYYSFAKAILNDQTIDVYNNGNLQRDFTYIDDIIQGTLAAIDLEANWELFNLGNNSPVTLMHFIQTLEKVLNRKAKLKFLPMQPGDVMQTYADISHSKKMLGFSPKTSIEEGLSHFAHWLLFRENNKTLEGQIKNR